MKKVISLTLTLIMVLSILQNYSYAAGSNLIQNANLSLKSTENPQRLEVSFDLTEPIDLSQGSSNIIFEYFTEDTNGNLEIINYKKDKSWSGYLNSYDNYPSGERKYSSGAENAAYSDNVPAAAIYTSAKTSASIDVSLIAAVRVTAIRADGSGEKATIYSDGRSPVIEKIEIPVAKADKSTGIRLASTTAEIPGNTVLVANELTSGPIFETVSTVLKNVREFMVFDIKLESAGNKINPDGKVKISIPIPENFNSSDLEVYRIDNDETITTYMVTVTTVEDAKFATFETEHFSTYVLAEVTGAKVIEGEAEKDETPKTGSSQIINYIAAIAILSAIGIAAFNKKAKEKNI